MRRESGDSPDAKRPFPAGLLGGRRCVSDDGEPAGPLSRQKGKGPLLAGEKKAGACNPVGGDAKRQTTPAARGL